MPRNRKGYPTPSAEDLERDRKVLDLRRAGLSFDLIAQQLDLVDRGHAYKAYKRAMNRGFIEPAADIRDLENDRLDRLLAAVWGKAMRGDSQAVAAVLRIMDRRARLNGLDHADGIAERTLALQASQAEAVVGVLRGVLTKLGLDPAAPEVIEIVTTELRAIEGAA